MLSDLEIEAARPDPDMVLVWAMRKILFRCPNSRAVELLLAENHAEAGGRPAWSRLCEFLHVWRAFSLHGIVINPPPVEFRSADEDWLVRVWDAASAGQVALLRSLIARRIAPCARAHACQILLRQEESSPRRLAS